MLCAHVGCNTQQHTLPHAATHLCHAVLDHETARMVCAYGYTATPCATLHRTATQCSTVQHPATHCNSYWHSCMCACVCLGMRCVFLLHTHDTHSARAHARTRMHMHMHKHTHSHAHTHMHTHARSYSNSPSHSLLLSRLHTCTHILTRHTRNVASEETKKDTRTKLNRKS